MMKRSLLATILCAAIAVPMSASAITWPDPNNENTMVFSLVGDHFRLGENLNIEENIDGDLVVLGSNARIQADVDGTINAAGDQMMISGDISQNVHAAGNTIRISGRVEGSVIAFGNNITIEEGAVIEGDIIANGASINLLGTINGDVYSRGENVTIGGTVNGTTDVSANRVTMNGDLQNTVVAAKTLQSAGGTVTGDLRYWSEGSQTLPNTIAVTGTSQFDNALAIKDHTQTKTMAALILGTITIFSILSTALIIGLMILLTRTYFKEAAVHLQKKPWWALLTGFLFFIAVPSLAVLFLITLIGWPIALMLVLYFIIVLLFAKALTALVLARWIELRAKKKWNGWIVFLVAMGVYIVLQLLAILPFIGWLVCMVSTFFAFGALLMVKYEKFQKVR